MKRLKYLVIILLFSFIIVDARVETYERTEDNYRVPSDITVTSYNKWNVLNTPSVDESKKVYDFAELLSDNQEKTLYNSIIKFMNNTGLEVVIVTIEDNPGKTIKDEAADFYDYNYFKTDGLIFLIDMEIREYSIVTTGLGMKTHSNDEVDLMLDGIYPYMVNKNYYDACSEFINLASKYYSTEATYDYYDYDNDNSSFGSGLFNAFIGATISTLVIILIMVFQCRMVRKANSSRNYLVEETKQINNLGEIKTGSNTTRVRIQSSSSSGGSGRSGGGSRSSSFRGSSGRSHGSGSRRF